MYRGTVWVLRKWKVLWLPRICCRSRGGGISHEVKGEGIYAYVTLNAGQEYNEELRGELKQQVAR